MGISELIEGNKKFVSGQFAQEKEKFAEIQKGQKPHTLMICCSDSRVAPEMIFAAGPGEIFVHRNIGNIAAPGDWNLATVLEYGIKHLKVKNLIICGHEECGAMKALGTGGGSGDDYVPGWLAHASEALDQLKKRKPRPDNPEDLKNWLGELEIENIKIQIEHLRTFPVVKNAEDNGSLELHGLYWSMSNGEVTKI